MPPRPSLFRRFGPALLSAVLGFAALPAVAQETPAPGDYSGDSGAFLAARVAANNSDYRAAADWFTRALVSDPKNPELLEGAILANIGLGEVEPAATLARALEGLGEDLGVTSEVGHLSLLTEAILADDFDAALKRSAVGAKSGALLDSLFEPPP